MPMLVSAHTLTVVPGELAASSPDSFPASGLVLEGSVDAADLDWLVRCVPAGGSVDLSAVKIVPYDGATVGISCSSAPADALPPYILAGLHASRLVLPRSLKTIGAGALLDAAVTSIDIPASVTSLGAAAFAGCHSLTAVSFAGDSTLDSIPSRCFDGCERLVEVSLPPRLTSVGTRAFAGCKSLTGLSFPTTLSSVATEAFAASGLEALDLAGCSSLRHIGARAWAECPGLASATLPAGAILSGEAIFMGCPLLTAVTLPSKATVIPALTLTGAEALTELTLPEAVDTIGALALAHASAVKLLALPATLRHIDTGAFEDCTGLEHIDASALEDVPTLGDDVWSGVECKDVTLRVTSEAERQFLDALQWQDFSIQSSGIVALPVDGDSGDGSISVSASFTGNTLVVSADRPMALVTVHSLEGNTLEFRPSHPEVLLSADTSALGGRVLIVTVRLEGQSSPVTLKLLRR